MSKVRNVLDYFKLLTPKRVTELTKGLSGYRESIVAKKSEETIEEVAVAEEVAEVEASNAKIIPFTKEKEEPLEVQEAVPQMRTTSQVQPETRAVTKGTGLESIGVVKSQEEIENDRVRKEEERRSRPSTSLFILSEKERTSQSQKRLLSQEAMKIYKVQSKTEISKTKDLTDSQTTGVLFKKDQF